MDLNMAAHKPLTITLTRGNSKALNGSSPVSDWIQRLHDSSDLGSSLSAYIANHDPEVAFRGDFSTKASFDRLASAPDNIPIPDSIRRVHNQFLQTAVDTQRLSPDVYDAIQHRMDIERLNNRPFEILVFHAIPGKIQYSFYLCYLKVAIASPLWGLFGHTPTIHMIEAKGDYSF